MSSQEEVDISLAASTDPEEKTVTSSIGDPDLSSASRPSKTAEDAGADAPLSHAVETAPEPGLEAKDGSATIPPIAQNTSAGVRDNNELEAELNNLRISTPDEGREPTEMLETKRSSLSPRELQPESAVAHEQLYLDPTPGTPNASLPPSRQPSFAAESAALAPAPKDESVPGQKKGLEIEQEELEQADTAKNVEDDSKSEIQSIMEQFDDEQYVPEESIPQSPIHHPPRHSSLEPLGFSSSSPSSTSQAPGASRIEETSQLQSSPPPGNAKSNLVRSISFTQSRFSPGEGGNPLSPALPSPALNKSLPPPPAPDPEPDLPFDFHRFLEQLRHRTADPVAKFLRSFLVEFGKKQWMVHEQVKIISDFLSFITGKMAQCEVWREVSDAEFDNAKEGMEKLVMNRLYSQTFSPVIPPPAAVSQVKGKKRAGPRQQAPGRRGQHQEDVERDEILAQKVRIYGWVREEHLDIAPVGESGRRFLHLAQQELLKIKSYRAPRDKVICVLNCCKVIFGLLRNTKSSDTSADSFIPLLIYVVLQANPEHLVSNVQYILRFRNQDKLVGEAGYYISSLMGAIQFIEGLDRTALTVSDEEFEKNVEAAVSAIAERENNEQQKPEKAEPEPTSEKSSGSKDATPRPSGEQLQRHELDASEVSTPSKAAEDKPAVPSLLRTIQRPLSNIGRIFSDDLGVPQREGSGVSQQTTTAVGEIPRRLSPAVFQTPRNSGESARGDGEARRAGNSPSRMSAEEAALRQASAEAAQAQRIQRAEHQDVVETLAGMFPNLDRDLIDDVVRMKNGRVGAAVDACLALNT